MIHFAHVTDVAELDHELRQSDDSIIDLCVPTSEVPITVFNSLTRSMDHSDDITSVVHIGGVDETEISLCH